MPPVWTTSSKRASAPTWENKTQWLPWLRTVAGFRADVYAYHDTDYTGHLSGDGTAAIVSPKFSLILGPWYKTELYLNGGYGFHSNDIRGVVGPPIPGNDAPKNSVNPLVKSKGAEVGPCATPSSQACKARLPSGFSTSTANSSSTAMPPTTSPAVPSQRWGVELANFYTPTPLAHARPGFCLLERPLHRPRAGRPLGARSHPDHARRRDRLSRPSALAGRRDSTAGCRLRYFGPRNLTQDATEKSDATTLVYLQLGYHFNPHLELTFDVFNLLDSQDADIDYYYVSRLPGEPATGVADRHTHQTEPRELRGGITYHF